MESDPSPEPGPKALSLRPEDPFSRALYALVMDERIDANLLGFASEDIALLSPGKGSASLMPRDVGVVLVRPRPGDPQQVALLKKLRKQLGFPLCVVVVGGGEEGRRLAEQSAPRFTSSRQYWLQLPETGEEAATSSGPSSAALEGTGKRLTAAEVLAAPPDIEADGWRRFLERCVAQAQESSTQQQEVRRFAKRAAAHRPVVTYAFLAAMGLMYLVELAFGAPESMPALVRLGAMRAPKLLEGEVWRLFSPALLHGDLTHLFVNAYVLFILGRFLEQIIGSGRFLVLLLASVLGGSLASAVFVGAAVSVGASGGLWGVLAGHALLAFRPGGLLPEAMLPGARKAAIFNLGLNVAISFLPQVDWAAHFGGGLVGAALMATVLRRGLPALGELSPTEEPAPVPSPSFGVRVAGGVLLALLAGSTLTAILVGQPWVLDQEPRYEVVRAPELGVELRAPAQLEEQAAAGWTDEAPLAEDTLPLGDLFAGPAACAVAVTEVGPDVGEVLDEPALAEIQSALRQAPEGAVLLDGPARTTLEDKPGVTVSYRYPNGLRAHRAITGEKGAIYKTECYVWPAVPAAWHDVAARMAGSIQGLPR